MKKTNKKLVVARTTLRKLSDLRITQIRAYLDCLNEGRAAEGCQSEL